MEGQEEIQNFPSSSTNGIDYQDNVKQDLSTNPMAINRMPEDIPDASGDSFHHVSGVSDQGQIQAGDPLMRQRPLLSRQALNEQAQQLIEKINDKRKRDTNVLEDFRKVLQDKVALSCSGIEERMYRMYEESGKNMQPKLQEFFATLDRIAAIEEELQHFKAALGVLYTDIQQSKP